MYVTFRACPYHHKARPACMSSTGWPPAAPASIVHTCRHSLTGLPRSDLSIRTLSSCPLSCHSAMAEPSVDPLVPHLFLLSLILFPLPSLCPLSPVFQLDDVDERHVAGRNITFGRPRLTLVILATPGWCHVPLPVDGHSLRGIFHIMLGSK